MKTLIRGLTLLSAISLVACTATTSKITRSDAEQLKGKGLNITVLPSGSPSSNLDGAMFFGALGQSVKGHALQATLKLPDPSIKVEACLRQAVTEKYKTSSSSDYVMTINTSSWWIGKPLGSNSENIYAAAEIQMKLVSPSGKTIASDTFNGIADAKKFPISPNDIQTGNTEKIRLAFDSLSEQAADKFITTLSD